MTEGIESVLNQASLRRLGVWNMNNPAVYRKPLEVFTCMKPLSPLLRALPLDEYKQARTEDTVRVRQLISLETTQSALIDVYRSVAGRATKERQRQVDRHDRRPNVKAVRFWQGRLRFSSPGATQGTQAAVLVAGPAPHPPGHLERSV